MDEEKTGSTPPHGEVSHSSSEQHEQGRSKKVEPAEEHPKRSRKWAWIILFVFIVLAVILYLDLRSGAPSGSASKAGAAGGRGAQGPAAITTGQSTTGNINIYVEALGTVTPTYTVTVYSQITGRVMAVHYQEGQLVKTGDPLVDIDPRPYEATLQQAQGSLQHDQGVLAQARIDLARYQAAWAKNAIAKQTLDDQEQAVVQYEGTVKADEGAVAYDKVQLEYCHIVAPITGRAGLRLVDPGNTVFSGTGSTLVVLTQLQPITVVFNVSEDDLPQVQAQLTGGRTLKVDIFDRSGDKQIESGQLTSLDNQIDTTTGTVKFRANIPNKNLVLFPNQFVNARLLVRTLRNAVLVPSAAVQHNGTSAFVYVVQPNNTVTVQNITTQTSNEQVTAVQGVNAGVTLATSGFDRLENGAQVLVRPQGQGQGQGKATTGGMSPQ
jgi:multidrug efflux system membrane fusion protein